MEYLFDLSYANSMKAARRPSLLHFLCGQLEGCIRTCSLVTLCRAVGASRVGLWPKEADGTVECACYFVAAWSILAERLVRAVSAYGQKQRTAQWNVPVTLL
jgi:hypothetical protein